MPLPLLVALVLGQTSFPDAVFLSNFPVSTANEIASGTVAIDTRVTGKAFGELTARRIAHSVGSGRFIATVSAYPESRDKPKKAHLACTFLIDCDEAPLRQVAEKAKSELGREKGIEPLVGWVSRYITKKTYVRAFDAASVVAASHEGDCTEHAVLLAALARVRKIPARVVTGLVLVQIADKTAAMGHAWVEWHDGKHWRLADAALTPEELAKLGKSTPVRLSYLPVRVIEREDAGFGAAMVEGPDSIDIAGVVVPGPAAARR